MANYEQTGNRWTMILIKKQLPGGATVTERATFDLVRFNVDTDPDAKQEIVPVGQGGDNGKLFERIWTVDDAPFKKQFFGGQA